MADTAKYKYFGPSDRLNGVARGGEVELSDEQVARLRRDGHRFETTDKRSKLPEMAPPPVVPATPPSPAPAGPVDKTTAA